MVNRGLVGQRPPAGLEDAVTTVLRRCAYGWCKGQAVNAVYVYAKDVRRRAWIGHAIAARQWPMGMTQAELDEAWCKAWVVLNGNPRDVSYRPLFLNELAESDDADRNMERSVLDRMTGALAATNIIEIEGGARLAAPFWIADQAECSPFQQTLLVRLKVRMLSECPDVQAYISVAEELDAATAWLVSLAKKHPDEAVPPEGSYFPARRVAEQTAIAVPMVLACETPRAKVVLRLAQKVSDNVFRANADVCGMTALGRGEILSRSISGCQGEKWESDIGEILEVG